MRIRVILVRLFEVLTIRVRREHWESLVLAPHFTDQKLRAESKQSLLKM